MLAIEEKIRAIEANEEEGDASQQYVLSVIAKSSLQTKTVIFNRALSGIIDLKRMTSIDATAINFNFPGKITRVVNIPKNIETFSCSKQMLTQVPEGLDDVESLYLANNYIQEIDLSKYPNLRVLNVKSNRLKTLKKIPPTIEELYLDNNSIRVLDLANLPALRIVHCNNNSMARIQNVPSTIVELQTDKGNPILKIDYAFKLTNEYVVAAKRFEANAHESEQEYLENLNEYFRLKSKYEEDLKKDRQIVRQMAVKRGMTVAQTRQRVASVVGKCVNCRRRVGTVFKQREMRYLAYCGDANEPCGLKFELYRGEYMNCVDGINFYRESIARMREDIIEHKMNTLFGFISDKDSADIFKRKMNLFQTYNKMYAERLEDYNNIYFSDERKELARLKQMKLYELERTMEDLMDEYAKEPNERILEDVATIMKKEYIPEREQLRKIKYATMHMEYSPFTGKERLIQTPLDYEKLDFLMGEMPSVLQASK